MSHCLRTIAMRGACWLAIGCLGLSAGCRAMQASAPAGLLRDRIEAPPARLALDENVLPETTLEAVAAPGPDNGPEIPRQSSPEPPRAPTSDRLPPTSEPLSKSPTAETLPAPDLSGNSPESRPNGGATNTSAPQRVPIGTLVEPALPEPLTLESSIELATRYNPRLDVLRERIARADGGQVVARADFLPEASGSYRHINGGPHPFIVPTLMNDLGVIGPGGPSDRFDRAELSVQWILYDFGRTSGKVGQAEMAADIARLQFQRGVETVAFDATAAYFAVLEAQAAIRIAEEGMSTAKSVQRDAQNFLQRGTIIRNDVLRADVLVAEMQMQLVAVRTERGAAVATLNQVLGINVSCPTRVLDRVEEPPFRLSLADCLQLAADNRDEFAVALDVIRGSRMGVGVARADFWPRIVVGGVAMQQQTADRLDFDELVAGGVNLELALFEGGRRVGQVRQAEAEVRGAVAQGKEMCDQIALEVNLAYLNVADARQRIDLCRTSVAQANENLRVVRRLQQQGDATQTDVIEAVLLRTRAEQGLAQALYDYQTSLARLTYATGIPATPGLSASLFSART
jgi:outer membrane protein